MAALKLHWDPVWRLEFDERRFIYFFAVLDGCYE